MTLTSTGDPGRILEVAVFTNSDAAKRPAADTAAYINVIMTSGDRKFETGFYQVGEEHEEYLGMGYDNDEFCYILTGSSC